MELTIALRAKPEKTQELYQALQALLPTIRAEQGCRDCRVCRDIEDAEVFTLAVEWEKVANLENYVHSGGCSALLGAVDILSETSRVRFGQDKPWAGIDSLKRMREKR